MTYNVFAGTLNLALSNPVVRHWLQTRFTVVHIINKRKLQLLDRFEQYVKSSGEGSQQLARDGEEDSKEMNDDKEDWCKQLHFTWSRPARWRQADVVETSTLD